MTVNYLQVNCSPQTPIQHSRSLNSLPNPDKYTSHSNTHYKHTTPSIKHDKQSINPTHKKLERARGANVLRPRVTFSEFTENINVISKEHKKLGRKENVLGENNKPKSILVGDNKHTGDTGGISTTTEDITTRTIDSETESEDHYKTLKCVEDDYSYAYR